MTTSKKSVLISTFATWLGVALVALPSAASAFSAAGDFSLSSNPNGSWSYGWSYGLGSAFNLDTTNTTSFQNLGLDAWLGGAGSAASPYALYNSTANPIANNFSVLQPGQLAESPGPSNQYSIVRWTAVSSGTFSIAATFSGLSPSGDSADVHILLNGTSFFNGTVGGPAQFTGPKVITAGDTIDFVVGNGGNGSSEDNTALSATIVPEPGTLELAGMGFGCLLSLRFLKRK
jgi:hypothetical protein